MTPTATLRPSLRDARTYALALIFTAGNIVLPQLCHLVPQGGPRWLPIYFFTLIAAFGYGRAAGLVTAVASPLANALLFGMPAAAALPVILIKGCLLALVADKAARLPRLGLLPALAVTVAGYQALGGAAEALLTGSPEASLQDITLGLPGLLVQIFGGWAVLRRLRAPLSSN